MVLIFPKVGVKMPEKETKLLDIGKIFSDEAEKIVKAREKCKDVHDTNIKAAGYEVEEGSTQIL
jgi:hypothetical protein